MKNLMVFFEIPAADFPRAVAFYEAVLGLKLDVSEYENEKMACFPAEDGRAPGAVSWSREDDFNPSAEGVLVHLRVDDLDAALAAAVRAGGRVTHPKTKIEAEGLGWFATFIDSEGNRLGLYAGR